MSAMNDTEFDRAMVASAFSLAAERGWSETSVTTAARAADLPLDRARGRFMGRAGILARFGQIADQAALANAASEGDSRDRLFDVVMRRIDVLQAHRAGVLALRDYLPRHPGLTLMLTAATAGSMAWMLEASGIPAGGIRGGLRVQGLTAAWLYVLRAWQSDESEDLGATMAALDKALDRAVQAEAWLPRDRDQPLPDEMAADVSAEPEPPTEMLPVPPPFEAPESPPI